MKVILAGESAGGNIACALILRLIKEKYSRVPDGLLLFYPPTECTGRFTPSGISGFEDCVAPVQLLHMCQESYVSDFGYEVEVSPLLLRNKFNVEKKIIVDEEGNET